MNTSYTEYRSNIHVKYTTKKYSIPCLNFCGCKKEHALEDLSYIEYFIFFLSKDDFDFLKYPLYINIRDFYSKSKAFVKF
jgi:hypothetical protein